MSEKFSALLEALKEISTLRSVHALLTWDQYSGMPPESAAFRGVESAYVEKLKHDKLTDPKLLRLVDECTVWAEAQGSESFEARLVKVTRRDIEWASKLP